MDHTSAAGLLTGTEVIAGASATVRDFWAWALSNLRSNAVRGMLAEYLVACAVGSRGRPRVDWDAYDVLTPRQERIEVKSAAYLQAWEQRRESAIIFRGCGRGRGIRGMATASSPC